jgi:RNA polymerase sigma-70 factor (ECF subfamily)
MDPRNEAQQDEGPSEGELVARAQAGDRSAYEALLERHLPGLEAFIRAKVGRGFGAREGASDVVQSTVRDLLQNAEQFRHGGEAAFRHWIYATAARKIADKHAFHLAGMRDRRREAGRAAESEEDPLVRLLARSASPTQKVSAAELYQRLEEAFKELSEDERQVVLLSKVMELSRAEVAAAIGRTENATRNLLHRALIKLAGRLDQTE